MTWGRNVAVAIDQGLNALTGGDADETLSSRWARARFDRTIAKLASKILDKIDKDHAFDAIERDPVTGQEEPHHMGGYQERRTREEECMIAALLYDYLDDESMTQAEMGFCRQRLREAMRDKAKGQIG